MEALIASLPLPAPGSISRPVAAPAPRRVPARGRLRGRVVVVTGASSGIGRAAARRFAREGARLTLVGRERAALNVVADECQDLGADVLVCAADVTDAIALHRVAASTVKAFGRIDVWVNNAGVGLFGPFVASDMEPHRRVVETNLIGGMNGAAAVLPTFLRQHGGVLITNISLGGFAPAPYAAAYTASKFGLRGFMAALRQELVHEPRIRVCSVFPSVINTPGFEHGANISGRRLRLTRPLYAPEQVADAMLDLALRPRDELAVGLPSRLARWGYALAPATTERVIGIAFRRYLRHGGYASRTLGNLFTPSKGRHQPTARPRDQPGSLAPVLAAIGGGLVAAAGTAWLLRSRSSPS